MMVLPSTMISFFHVNSVINLYSLASHSFVIIKEALVLLLVCITPIENVMVIAKWTEDD